MIGSAGIKINHEMPISDSKDIDLLMESEQSANNLIDFLFERIRHDMYRVWKNEHVTLEKGCVRKDESKAALATRVGGVTFFYQSVPIASIEISVANPWMKNRTFIDKNVMLPQGVLFNGQPCFKVPVLSDKHFMALDLQALDENINSLGSLFNRPQDEAVDAMLYCCQSLFKVNKRIPFYQRVIQGHQTMPDCMLQLCEKFNLLLLNLTTQDELLPIIWQRARALEYEKKETASDKNNSNFSKVNGAKSVGHSFEELQVKLRKELFLSRINGDGNCFYQTIAEILNDDRRMRSRFIQAESLLLDERSQRNVSENITQKDVRVLIHHWLVKAVTHLPPEELSRLNTLILVEGFSLKEALSKKIILDSAFSGQDDDHFGWSNLLNIISFITGFNFAVVQPNSARQKIDVCPYGNRSHDPLYCELAKRLSHIQGLVFDFNKEPLVGNMKFMVFSGSDHYCKATPNFLLSKRLKLLREAEEVLTSFQHIKPDELVKGSQAAKKTETGLDGVIPFDRTIFAVPPLDVGALNKVFNVAQPLVLSQGITGDSDKTISGTVVSPNEGQPTLTRKKKKRHKKIKEVGALANESNRPSETSVAQTQSKRVSFSLAEPENKNDDGSPTQSVCDDQTTPVKTITPVSADYPSLNKVIGFVEMQLGKGSVSGDFKIKLREKLLNDLMPLLSVGQNLSLADYDFIKIDFSRIEGALAKGLALADKLEDPIAPVILGMQQLLSLDPLNVDNKRLWSTIWDFVKAAQRGNVQGAFNLYWLAALTGSAEALGVSFTAIKNCVDNPKEKVKVISCTIPDHSSLLKNAAKNIIMPAVVKHLAMSRAPEKLYAAYRLLETVYPKSEILKLLLTPNVLFDDTDSSHLDKEQIKSSLTYFTHEGSAYCQRGQELKAISYFMPAAMGYALLVKNKAQTPLSGIVQACGLYSTYQCLDFFTSYRSSDKESQLPAVMKQWEDYFGPIREALSSVSFEHDLCQIIVKGKLASTPLALSESRVQYIKNRSKANAELSSVTAIDKDIWDRSLCLQGKSEFLAMEDVDDYSSATVGVELGKGHKPLKVAGLNRKRSETCGRKKIAATKEALRALGDVITELKREAWGYYDQFKYEPEYEKANTEALQQVFFEDVYTNVATIVRILKKDVSAITERVKCSVAHSKALEREIENLTLTCCLSFSQLVGLSGTKLFDTELAEHIEYLQRTLITEDRMNAVFLQRQKKPLIQELYTEFKKNAVLLLNPELYKEFNRVLCGSLFNAFFVYNKIFSHPQFDEKQQSVLLALFEKVVFYFNHYDDMSALLFAMSLAELDFNNERCLLLLTTALDKYWLSVLTSVEIDDQEKHFNYMIEYVSALNFSGKQALLQIWQKERDEYKMEMDTILDNRKAYAYLIWSDLLKGETQKKTKAKEKRTDGRCRCLY